jgi:hypothetical protein
LASHRDATRLVANGEALALKSWSCGLAEFAFDRANGGVKSIERDRSEILQRAGQFSGGHAG